MRLSAILIILLAINFSASAQTTYYVPDDFSTINGAISDASVVDGDTIIVRPGTYKENVHFLGKDILLRSELGYESTTLDGGQAGSTITFDGGEAKGTLLDGFTILNGSGTLHNSYYSGSAVFSVHPCHATISSNLIIGDPAICSRAIYCEHLPNKNSLTIINNTFRGTPGSTDYMAMIVCQYSDSVIDGNLIEHCSTAIESHSSKPKITNNRIVNTLKGFTGYSSYPQIKNNFIHVYGTGHSSNGIYCPSGCAPTIDSNIITGEGTGYCIRLEGDSNGKIKNNIIQGLAYGISCDGNCSPDINNNTIVGQMVAGLKCTFSSPNVRNTIFWDTTSINKDAFSYPTVIYCNVSYPGVGNIYQDPLFSDLASGDFHLTYSSPCRNAGNGGSGELDYEGDPRVAEGTVDMGADEFYPHLYYLGDATPSGAIQAKFVGLPGTLINGVLLGVNIFDPPLPCDYGLWYMDNPFQVITGLGAIPSTGIAVFPGAVPATPPAPYTIYLQGVIDMELTNLCPVQVE